MIIEIIGWILDLIIGLIFPDKTNSNNRKTRNTKTKK